MRLKALLTALVVGAVFVSHAKAGNNDAAAIAVDKGYRIVYGGGGTPLLKAPSSVQAGASAGEAMIMDMFSAPGPAGKGVQVGATRTIPWGAVARGAARAAGWGAVALTIYDVYDRMRVKPDGSGGWKYDEGQGQIDSQVWNCGTSLGWATSASECYARSVESSRAAMVNGDFGAYVTGTATCTSSGSCSGLSVIQTYKGNYWAGPSPRSFAYGQTHQLLCPAVVDFSDPRYSVPGGPSGPDGKCPTGRYNPITEAEAEAKMVQYGDKAKVKPMVEELLAKDHEFQPKPAVKVSGAPKVEMPPKVKTETDAQGNTKTTTTKDVYNITYQGDTYTWNVTTVTVNSDGTTTEETDPDPVSPPADPELGAVPNLYDQKYPEGIAGVWQKESAGLKSTPIFQFLGSLNPNLSSGGCPVWHFSPGTVLGVQVAGDISVPCYVWSFLRVFMICCALLLARALIFGG